MNSKLKNMTIAALALALAACSDSSGNTTSGTECVMSVLLHPDTWTYISLGDGKTVGTSDLGDDEADRSWHDRTDWDIALCNGIIRTNSGTSGRGQGGIMSSPQSFDNIVPSAVASLHADTDTVTVWRKGN